MAFPTGWLRKCPLVIQHTLVPSNQTQFPVLLTNATNCLPAEMVTTGDPNAAQSDGGDLRFSTDLVGAHQIACEVVQFTQNATASSAVVEIWVPVDILTGSDVTIYVWYSAGGGLSQPAASSTYGSQAVWDSNFNSVAHFGDGTTLNLVESTSNGHTATNHSGVAGAGKYGGGVSFGSASNYLDWPSGSAPSGATDATIEFWFKGTSGLVLFDQGDFSSAGHRCLIYEPSSVTVADCFGQSVISSSGNPKDGSWHLIQVQAFNSTVIFHIYFDGASVSTGTPAANKSTVATPILLSQSVGGGNGMVGVFDEFRASHVLRSADWILTNYRTQNSPGTFTLAGTPVSGGTGSGSLFKSGTLDGLSAGGPFFSNPIG